MKSLLLSLFCIPTFLILVKAEPESKELFGEKFQSLDHLSTGEWWKRARPPEVPSKKGKPPKRIIELNVPRDQVVAFALYTQDSGILKLSGQLYPLMPDESREVRLETKEGKEWKEIARVQVHRLDRWLCADFITQAVSRRDHPCRI